MREWHRGPRRLCAATPAAVRPAESASALRGTGPKSHCRPAAKNNPTARSWPLPARRSRFRKTAHRPLALGWCSLFWHPTGGPGCDIISMRSFWIFCRFGCQSCVGPSVTRSSPMVRVGFVQRADALHAHVVFVNPAAAKQAGGTFVAFGRVYFHVVGNDSCFVGIGCCFSG